MRDYVGRRDYRAGELHMEGNTKETVEKSAEPKENRQGKVTVPYGEMLVNLRKETEKNPED